MNAKEKIEILQSYAKACSLELEAELSICDDIHYLRNVAVKTTTAYEELLSAIKQMEDSTASE